MRTIRQHLPASVAHADAKAIDLPLDFDARKRSRQRIALDDGSDLAIALPAGSVLREGDLLEADDGTQFRIRARAQPVLCARSEEGWLLLRAAYHLGNRHVPVAVLPDRLLLEPDSVLHELLERLGLAVTKILAPFEPEGGAYGGGHRHGHDATFDADHALAQALYDEHAAAPATHAFVRPA